MRLYFFVVITNWCRDNEFLVDYVENKVFHISLVVNKHVSKLWIFKFIVVDYSFHSGCFVSFLVFVSQKYVDFYNLQIYLKSISFQKIEIFDFLPNNLSVIKKVVYLQPKRLRGPPKVPLIT